MAKTVADQFAEMNGRTDEVLDLAATNLWR